MIDLPFHKVATPARLAADLQAAGRWFADEGGPRQLRSLDSQLRELWTRLRYLTTWHVYGRISNDVYF